MEAEVGIEPAYTAVQSDVASTALSPTLPDSMISVHYWSAAE